MPSSLETGGIRSSRDDAINFPRWAKPALRFFFAISSPGDARQSIENDVACYTQVIQNTYDKESAILG
jgi:hypothetical protein